jgi:hypothetical protein
VVREGEDIPKKKGWFSRNKTVPTPAAKTVSRPPSAARFPSMSLKRTSTAPHAPEDDGLPPRLSKEGAQSAAGTDSPSDAPRSSADGDGPTGVPAARAGFDFKAIKEVIGTVEREPGPPPTGQASPFAMPPIPPPSERSESVPPPMQRGAVTMPAASASTHRASTDASSSSWSAEAGSTAAFTPAMPSSSSSFPAMDDLHGRFARSVSMSNMRAREPEVDADMAMTSSPLELASAANPSNGPTVRPLGATPALSFGGLDGSVWGAPSTQESVIGSSAVSGPYGSQPRQASSSMLSLGADPSAGMISAGTAVPLAAPPYGGGASSRSALHTPFGGSSAGLSFGAADGSITGWGGAAADPWTAAGDAQAKARTNAGGYASNPWQ